MEAEKPADAPVVVPAKPAEAPAVKLDDVRPKKDEAAASKSSTAASPAPAAPKVVAKPAVTADPALKPLGERARGLAESYGYHAAGALIVLGVGWIIGANSFDSRANERRVAEALRALDTKIEMVSAKVVTGTEVAALKRNLDEMKQRVSGTNKTTAAIAELRTKFEASEKTRAASADAVVDRVAERMGNLTKEQGERLDKLAERLENIDKQLASQFPTASIPSKPSTAVAPHQAEPVQIPGVQMPMASTTPTAAPVKEREARTAADRKLPENGYVLREVYNGIAVVEGRRGLMEVGPGDTLPGAGRVRSIERRNRQWVVVTSNGVIDSSGY
jgi:hypothetical protein